MRANEVNLGSHVADTPDVNAADSKCITGPLPELVAQALTYLRMSFLTLKVSRKHGGGRN